MNKLKKNNFKITKLFLQTCKCKKIQEISWKLEKSLIG